MSIVAPGFVIGKPQSTGKIWLLSSPFLDVPFPDKDFFAELASLHISEEAQEKLGTYMDTLTLPKGYRLGTNEREHRWEMRRAAATGHVRPCDIPTSIERVIEDTLMGMSPRNYSYWEKYRGIQDIIASNLDNLNEDIIFIDGITIDAETAQNAIPKRIGCDPFSRMDYLIACLFEEFKGIDAADYHNAIFWRVAPIDLPFVLSSEEIRACCYDPLKEYYAAIARSGKSIPGTLVRRRGELAPTRGTYQLSASAFSSETFFRQWQAQPTAFQEEIDRYGDQEKWYELMSYHIGVNKALLVQKYRNIIERTAQTDVRMFALKTSFAAEIFQRITADVKKENEMLAVARRHLYPREADFDRGTRTEKKELLEAAGFSGDMLTLLEAPALRFIGKSPLEIKDKLLFRGLAEPQALRKLVGNFLNKSNAAGGTFRKQERETGPLFPEGLHLQPCQYEEVLSCGIPCTSENRASCMYNHFQTLSEDEQQLVREDALFGDYAVQGIEYVIARLNTEDAEVFGEGQSRGSWQQDLADRKIVPFAFSTVAKVGTPDARASSAVVKCSLQQLYALWNKQELGITNPLEEVARIGTLGHHLFNGGGVLKEAEVIGRQLGIDFPSRDDYAEKGGLLEHVPSEHIRSQLHDDLYAAREKIDKRNDAYHARKKEHLDAVITLLEELPEEQPILISAHPDGVARIIDETVPEREQDLVILDLKHGMKFPYEKKGIHEQLYCYAQMVMQDNDLAPRQLYLIAIKTPLSKRRITTHQPTIDLPPERNFRPPQFSIRKVRIHNPSLVDVDGEVIGVQESFMEQTEKRMLYQYLENQLAYADGRYALVSMESAERRKYCQDVDRTCIEKELCDRVKQALLEGKTASHREFLKKSGVDIVY